MAGQWTNNYAFNTGAIRRKDLVYLAAAGDEHIEKGIARSMNIVWGNGKYFAFEMVDRCVGVAVARYPIEQGIFVGESGKVFAMGSNDQHEETIGTGKDSPKGRGPLRCARAIDGKIYAAGMDRQVYLRQDRNQWAAIDLGARPRKMNEDEIIGFEGIDGFGPKDLYAVGWNGEIWQYKGKRWKRIDSPTNVILTNVCCAGNGKVYACGRVGMLLRGRDDDWEVIAHESTEQDFWGIAWYNDRLYLASMHAVFTLEDDDSLKVVDFDNDVPDTYYHLSAGDGMLWSIGPKDVMAFDGKEWDRID
ncbi:MAG: hypothetical protein K8T89_01530 [Planctomycetes bacterium]|nr:hypothetical protein [Planctomycetota bacterium]